MDGPGHGDHGGHDDMDSMCAMNMSFNWSTDNVCILFDFWRITGTTSLVLSCVAVFALGYTYEWFRASVRTWERSLGGRASGAASPEGLPTTGSNVHIAGSASPKTRWYRSLLYGLLVAYSYCLMLIFMTYNCYLVLAIFVGAVIGYHKFSVDELGAVRGANCH